MLKFILVRNKYEFLVAIDGKQAVEVYHKNWEDIGVIFMDYEMPVMNGLEATKEIRKLQHKNRFPKIKIYAVTGHVEYEYVKACKDAGMDEMLPIPFSSDTFMVAATESLNKYRDI